MEANYKDHFKTSNLIYLNLRFFFANLSNRHDTNARVVYFNDYF